MVEAPLVVPDLEFGHKVLRVLDRAEFPVTVAMWMRDRDNIWNLVISSPLYDDIGQRPALVRLRAALSTDGPTAISLLPIRLLAHSNPLIKALRKMFGKAASVAGMRLGGHDIGGVYVGDAYVYRIK